MSWDPTDDELREISEAWWESNSARRLALLALKERQLRRDAEASALRQRLRGNDIAEERARDRAALMRVESLKPTHIGDGQWIIHYRDLVMAVSGRVSDD